MSVQVRAVCEICGRKSRWHDEEPESPGRVGMSSIARGWSVAPYPTAFEHPNGTHGDKWSCPACMRRLSAGQTLQTQAVECTETRSAA
jgi:hypothetical protein